MDVCCPIRVLVVCAQRAKRADFVPSLFPLLRLYRLLDLFGLGWLAALCSPLVVCVVLARSWCAAAEADPRHQGLPAEGSPVS